VPSHGHIIQLVKAEGGSTVSNVVQQVFVGNYERLQDAYINPWEVFDRVDLTHFTGREWLMERVDAFLKENDRGYFILEAEAGLGKTTFLAWLVRQRGYVHNFCELTRGLENVESAIRNLAAQLILEYHLSAWELYGVLPVTASGPGFLRNLLAQVVEKKLPGEKIVLVIDALDEAGSPENQNVLGLPSVLPEGVYVITSMRPVGGIPLQIDIASTPRVKVQLAPESLNNRADLLQFLRSSLKRPGIAAKLAETRTGDEQFIQILLSKSQGVWVYLHYVISEVEKGQRTLNNWDDLPNGLVQYYASYWNRWRKRDERNWQDTCLPLLAGLTVAQEALTLEGLCALVGLEYKPALNSLFIEEWSPFLAVDVVSDVAYYRLYHTSLMDFFEGRFDRRELTIEEIKISNQIADAIRQAHSSIASRYTSKPHSWEEDGGYAFKHLHTHILRNSPTALFRLLEDPVWLEAQRKYDYTLETYSRGINAAIKYLGMQSAASTVPRAFEFSLLSASISSLATSYTPGILAAWVYLGESSQVLRYTSLMVDPEKKVECLLHITEILRKRQEHNAVNRAIEQLLIALEAIPDAEHAKKHYGLLTSILTDMKYCSGLDRLLALICRKKDKSSALTLIQTIASTGLWSDPEALSGALQQVCWENERAARLLDLAGWYADGGGDHLVLGTIETAAQFVNASEKSELPVLYARMCVLFQRINQPAYAEAAYARAFKEMSKAERGEYRLRACLEMSRTAGAKQRTGWLMEALGNLKSVRYYFSSELVPELLWELIHQKVAVDDIDLVAALGVAYEKRGDFDFWYGMKNAVVPLSTLTEGASNLRLLALVPEDSSSKSQAFPTVAEGIAAYPTKPALDAIIDRLENSEKDWVYIAEVIKMIGPVTVLLEDRQAMERLFQIGLQFSYDNALYQDMLWEGLSPAYLHFNPNVTVRQWFLDTGGNQAPAGMYDWIVREEEKLDKRERSVRIYNRLAATLYLCCALVSTGQPQKAIDLAQKYQLRSQTYHSSFNQEYNLYPAFYKHLMENGYLDDAWRMLGIRPQATRLKPRTVGLLQTAAVCADARHRMDLLETVARVALRIKNAGLIETTAPLLAKNEKLDLAQALIQEYQATGAHLKSDYHMEGAQKALQEAAGLGTGNEEAAQLAKEIKLWLEVEKNKRKLAARQVRAWLKTKLIPNHYERDWRYEVRYSLRPYRENFREHENTIGETLYLLAKDEAWGAIRVLLDEVEIGSTWQYDEPMEKIKAVAALFYDDQLDLLFALFHKISDKHIARELWLDFCEFAWQQSGEWLLAFLDKLSAWCMVTADPRLDHAWERKAHDWPEMLNESRDTASFGPIHLHLAVAVVLARNGLPGELREVLLGTISIFDQAKDETHDALVKRSDIESLVIGLQRQARLSRRETMGEGELSAKVNQAASALGRLTVPLVIGLLSQNWREPEEFQTRDLLFAPDDYFLFSSYSQLHVISLAELAARCGMPMLAAEKLEAALRDSNVAKDSRMAKIDPWKLNIQIDAYCNFLPFASQLGLSEKTWKAIDALLPTPEKPKEINIESLPELSSLLRLFRFAGKERDWERAEKILLYAVLLCTRHTYDSFLQASQEFPMARGAAGHSALRAEIERRAEMIKTAGSGRAWFYLPAVRAVLAKPLQWTREMLLSIQEQIVRDQERKYYSHPDNEFFAAKELLRVAEQLHASGLYEDAGQVAGQAIMIMEAVSLEPDRSYAWSWLWMVVERLKDPKIARDALRIALASYSSERRKILKEGFLSSQFIADGQPELAVQLLKDLLASARRGGRGDVWDYIFASICWVQAIGGGEAIREIIEKTALVETLFPSDEKKMEEDETWDRGAEIE
jgi:hypothetical protein